MLTFANGIRRYTFTAVDPSGHNFFRWLVKLVISEPFVGGLSIGATIGEGWNAIHDIREGYRKRDESNRQRNAGGPTAGALRPEDPGEGSDHRRSDPTRRVGPKPGDPSVRGGPEQETD